MNNEKNVILEISNKQVSLPFISELSVEKAANKIHYGLIEGDIDPIKVASLFKFTADTYSKLKDLTDEHGKNSLVDLVRESIENKADDKKTIITEDGIKFSLAEVGTSYDFSNCGDFEWNELNNQIKDLKEQLKEREKFLKGIKGSVIIGVVDKETGELVNKEIYEPVKTSTSSFKSEFVKEKK